MSENTEYIAMAQEHRVHTINGLRMLADALNNDDDMPCPPSVETRKHYPDYDEFVRVAKDAGTTITHAGSYDNAIIAFGPVRLILQADASVRIEREFADRIARIEAREQELGLVEPPRVESPS